MSLVEKYKELDQKMFELRMRIGPIDSPEEDALIDEMDEIWYALSTEEQDEINEFVRKTSPSMWAELEKQPEWKQFFDNKQQRK